MIGRSRNRLRHVVAALGQRRARGAGDAAHAARPPELDEAADHDHADEDHALGDDGEVGVDVQEGHVRPDQLEDDDRDDRAEDAASTAGEADAAEDDRGDAQRACTGPGTGVPIPVLAVTARPASAANRPVTM